MSETNVSSVLAETTKQKIQWFIEFTIDNTRVVWIINDSTLSIISMLIGMGAGQLIFFVIKKLVTKLYILKKRRDQRRALRCLKPQGGAGLVDCLTKGDSDGRFEVVNEKLQEQILNMLGEKGMIIVGPSVALIGYAALRLSNNDVQLWKLTTYLIKIVNLEVGLIGEEFIMKTVLLTDLFLKRQANVAAGGMVGTLLANLIYFLLSQGLKIVCLDAFLSSASLGLLVGLIVFLSVPEIDSDNWVRPVPVGPNGVPYIALPKLPESKVIIEDTRLVKDPLYGVPYQKPQCEVQIEVEPSVPALIKPNPLFSNRKMVEKTGKIKCSRDEVPIKKRVMGIKDLKTGDGTDIRALGEKYNQDYEKAIRPQLQQEEVRIRINDNRRVE